MEDCVIRVENLQKSYGKLSAVEDVSLEVFRGEIFGIVGPNGAGKTTTVECIEGIRHADSGNLEVLGLHPHKNARKLKQQIGIQLQESQLPDRIKVWEALSLFGDFYKKHIPWHELLESLGLMDKKNAYYDSLSGGQKQRLSIAMSLINDPQVVFFDELTTGLDPQARRNIWELVKEVQRRGKTVVLVTHFMEEAEKLCDRMAIIDHGKVIALDSPKNLIKSLGPDFQIHFTARENHIQEKIGSLPHIHSWNMENDEYSVHADNVKAIADLINLLGENNVEFDNFHIQQPNLEDVFIHLTGRNIRD